MKTKLGTYYYIQVGPSYYAGTKPVMVEATRTVVDAVKLKELRKQVPKYQLDRNGQFGRFLMRGQDRKYKQRYGTWTDTPKKSVDVLVPSGTFVDDWTTDFTKAKQFRIHSKAVAKAAELAKSFAMETIKPKIELFEGDR